MTENDMTQIMSIGEQVDQANAHHARAHQFAGMALEEAVLAGKALIALKGRIGHGQWAEHVAGKLAFSEDQAKRYMKLARELPQIGANSARVRYLPSIRAALAALAAPEEIKEQFVEKIQAGETFTAADVKAARDAAKAEAQKDASADIQKREKAISKLRAQLAALETDDKADILKDLAAKLDEERAARVKAEAIAEAASKNLSVVAPKVIHTTDPEQAARLAKAEREAADLADQLRRARETIKVRDEQIAKADEVSIRNLGERMRNSAPAEFVTTFCTQTTEEYLRRLRGAVQVANKAPHLFTPEMTIPLQEVRDLLNAIEDACAIVQVA